MAGFAFGIMISAGFSSAEGGENGGISGGGPKDGSKGAAGAGADAGEGAGNAFLREMIFFKLSTSFSSWLTLSARLSAARLPFTRQRRRIPISALIFGNVFHLRSCRDSCRASKRASR